MSTKGIAVAGNIVVDRLFPVHGLPVPGELTNITGDEERSSGGILCNCSMDLAALDPDLPVTAIGLIGNDAEGDFILEKLSAYPNISVSGIKRGDTATSSTLVMADEITKQRSFYHWKGPNVRFCEDDLGIDTLDADILHIGYILLLDELDSPDAEYGTKMARLLHDVRERGIKTSVDVVTENSKRFASTVSPALKFCNYCIINEVEAASTTGIMLRDENGMLVRGNIRPALEAMHSLGVSDWAVIHCPEGGFGIDGSGDYFEVPSLTLPEGYIKGSVGAGDAFCSGVLYAAWKGLPLFEALKLGTAAAACSLSEPGASAGMRSYEKTMELYGKYSEEA